MRDAQIIVSFNYFAPWTVQALPQLYEVLKKLKTDQNIEFFIDFIPTFEFSSAERFFCDLEEPNLFLEDIFKGAIYFLNISLDKFIKYSRILFSLLQENPQAMSRHSTLRAVVESEVLNQNFSTFQNHLQEFSVFNLNKSISMKPSMNIFFSGVKVDEKMCFLGNSLEPYKVEHKVLRYLYTVHKNLACLNTASSKL